jgi:hypothetical protein
MTPALGFERRNVFVVSKKEKKHDPKISAQRKTK